MYVNMYLSEYILNWVTCTDFIGNLEWFDIIINSCLYVCIDTCVRKYVYFNKSVFNTKCAIETADLQSAFQRH